MLVAESNLRVGGTSALTVTFSEPVLDFDNSDVTVDNGTLSPLVSSDGGVTWTATLTPTAGVTDSSNVVTVNLGGVTDTSGNLGLADVESNNYAIDTQRPTASLIVSDTELTVGETALVTVTFSEKVMGFSNADLVVSSGSLSPVSSTDAGQTWTATLTPSADVTDASNLITLDLFGVTDAAGNTGWGASDSNDYRIDTQRPMASIVVSDLSVLAGETTLVTFTFSEAVSGFTTADLTVPNGSVAPVSSTDGGITWSTTFTPSAGVVDPSTVITLDLSGVTDTAGNTGVGTTDSNTYSVNTQRPSGTVVVADTAIGLGETSPVTFAFSEPVTGFSNADLTVENGTLTPASTADGGVTWTATFTPTNDVTDAANAITANLSGVVNAAGNTGSGIATSNGYAVDTKRPTATVLVADSTTGASSPVTITFSEAVTGFTDADVSAPNGTLSTVASSDGGVTWSAKFTPNAGVSGSSNSITINLSGVADSAGNAGMGTAISNTFTISTAAAASANMLSATGGEIGGLVLLSGFLLMFGLAAFVIARWRQRA